jgi:hypothetical protein
MTPRPYWLQSDGELNPQWRRLWTEPPWPKREPVTADAGSRPEDKTNTAVDFSRHPDETEARRTAEALFAARLR